MDTRSRKLMVVQIAVGLLCVLMVAATLDAVPDPPAVTQRIQHSLVSPIEHRVPPRPTVTAVICLICSPQIEAESFFVGQALEGTYRWRKVELVPQVADTSPPSHS